MNYVDFTEMTNTEKFLVGGPFRTGDVFTIDTDGSDTTGLYYFCVNGDACRLTGANMNAVWASAMHAGVTIPPLV